MKNTCLLVCFLFTSFIMYGQDSVSKTEKTPADIAKIRSEHLGAKLNLSEDQKSKVYQIILEEEKEKESERIKRNARTKKNQESIKKVLTPEQLKEFELLKEKRTDARKQHRQKMRGNLKTPADKKTIEN
ncbi:MAG: hypothetical protein EYC69_06445 [Bacteroidetes bacterium]|nr:MAG: hypothetical protein EYC69_06445 [Bacteroidota bacterium]